MQSWHMAGSHPKDYQQGIDMNTHEGKNIAYLKSAVEEPAGFGTLMQKFKADAYCNKRMCFSAFVKAEGVEGWAGLWMRLDGLGRRETLGFDNMHNRAIKGTIDRQKYEVVLDVPVECAYIAFGFILSGKGQIFLSDVHFEKAETVTASPRKSMYPDKPNLDFLN